MSNYEIQNVKYSMASNLYDRHARITQQPSAGHSEVRDSISINHQRDIDFGGVQSMLQQKADILSSGDKIIVSQNQSKTGGFLNLIKEKFDAIKKSEVIAKKDLSDETNLVELRASTEEAEITVLQIAAVADKIISSYKAIVNSAF